MLVGAKLDRYRIEALLGEGGMGSVYRAHDETLHRRVALKVLLAVDDADPTRGAEAKARLLREARAAAALHHPNAVAIFDVGEHEGAPYIAMELVSGKSLRALLADLGQPWRERLRWLVDVGKALSAAHRAGLVHRDIKPDNVMLGDDGVIKVLDFGIARRAKTDVDATGPTDAGGLATLTAEGAVIGTPLYMAPEQIRGGDVDGRTDQFAWGVLGWELLSGSPPWAARDLISLVASISLDEPPPLILPAGCPLAIETTLRRALAKSPANRFASMEEAIAAIESDLAAKPAVARGASAVSELAVTEAAPPSPASRTPEVEVKAPRSNARLIAALALVAAVVAVLSSGVLGPKTAPTSLAASASAALAGPVPTRTIDLPLPTSKSPEAVAAYRLGVQALRDASWKVADDAFVRALTLDPEMAIAHLRAAFTARDNRPSEVRKHFARATELRRELSERDRMFLAALEPLLAADPPDEAESTRRFGAAAAKFPGDAELVGLHCYVGRSILGNEAAIVLARRSVTLDPDFADGWQTLGDIAGDLGRMSEAREALERCVQISPASTDCRVHLALADELEGHCDRAEARLRNVIASRPELASTPVPLWPSALLAIGRPRAAVQQALEQRWSRIPEEPELVRLIESAALDAFYGDFTSALRKLDDFDRAARSTSRAQVHASSTALRVDIETEMGRPLDAARDAASFLAKKDAFMASAAVADPTPHLLYVAHRGGLVDQAKLVSARGAWMDASRSLARAGAWAKGYGSSETAAEAAEAIAALPAEGLPKSYFRHTDEAGEVGRILLLVGRAPESVPLLTIGAKSCRSLLEPIGQTRNADSLGRALEATGDKAGACAAYKVVVDRWGGASPRSITSDHARAQSKALGCSD